MIPDYSIESELIGTGYSKIVGVDEVGRGCGMGSVVAAAVYVPPETIPLLTGRVNDSKKLSPRRREELYEIIISNCEYGIGDVDNNTIDAINILEATKIAMKRSINMISNVDFAIIDGNVTLKHVNYDQRCVIKGDSKSISIAAASIVAKVYRDNCMNKLHEEFSVYGWSQNKGYLTKEHCDAMAIYGLTPYHRKTFGKVKDFIGDSDIGAE